METFIVERVNLQFSGPNLGDARTHETYDEVAANSEFHLASLKLVKETMNFIQPQHQPPSVRIVLESEGTMTFEDGTKEFIPMSLITSQRQPAKSEIRIGIFELINDVSAFESILAHELGHMLVEWPCRLAGITGPGEFVVSHWDKPIYEGVADWFSAVLTGQTLIGSQKIWFSRSINQFNSLDEARLAPKMLLVDLENGLNSLGLIQKYRAYSEWMDLVQKYIANINDPYSEGTWIAGQLWKISNGKEKSKELASKIIELALSGEKISDPNAFLSRLNS